VWMIESSCATATDGFWRETPGRALLAKLRSTMGELPIVAEDLGIITEEVRQLRKDFVLPGMAVLQFAFDGSMENPHRPENITFDTVAYTGTHDNNTCVGWFESLDEREKGFVFEVLGRPYEQDIAAVMIEETYRSDACLAIAPLQDFLGLGANARMNTPGATQNNWRWKFQWQQMSDSAVSRIGKWVDDSGRYPDA
jgi:4-alpha-glucanotransferase